MATTLYMSPITMIVQYMTNLGLLAAGGTVNTYVGGTVNTPADTYTDSTGTVKNPNGMTLNAAARPALASGFQPAFWTLPGVVLKLVVTDALGNQLVSIDNIPAVNDLTNSTVALQAALANPASSNSQGVGPVAGADLVANAVKSYDVFASVRAANAPLLVNTQTLIIEVQGATAIDDGLGGTFYWNASSTLPDDGRTVLKSATAGNGRWIRVNSTNVLTAVSLVDQQVQLSTTLTASTALSLPLNPGSYDISVRLQLAGIGGTGQGYKVGMGVNNTIGGNTICGGVASANGVAAAVAGPIGVVPLTVTGATISNTTGDFVNLDFSCVLTGVGVVAIFFAQNSSSANATVLKAGSVLTATRVA